MLQRDPSLQSLQESANESSGNKRGLAEKGTLKQPVARKIGRQESSEGLKRGKLNDKLVAIRHDRAERREALQKQDAIREVDTSEDESDDGSEDSQEGKKLHRPSIQKEDSTLVETGCSSHKAESKDSSEDDLGSFTSEAKDTKSTEMKLTPLPDQNFGKTILGSTMSHQTGEPYKVEYCSINIAQGENLAASAIQKNSQAKTDSQDLKAIETEQRVMDCVTTKNNDSPKTMLFQKAPEEASSQMHRKAAPFKIQQSIQTGLFESCKDYSTPLNQMMHLTKDAHQKLSEATDKLIACYSPMADNLLCKSGSPQTSKQSKRIEVPKKQSIATECRANDEVKGLSGNKQKDPFEIGEKLLQSHNVKCQEVIKQTTVELEGRVSQNERKLKENEELKAKIQPTFSTENTGSKFSPVNFAKTPFVSHLATVAKNVLGPVKLAIPGITETEKKKELGSEDMTARNVKQTSQFNTFQLVTMSNVLTPSLLPIISKSRVEEKTTVCGSPSKPNQVTGALSDQRVLQDTMESPLPTEQHQSRVEKNEKDQSGNCHLKNKQPADHKKGQDSLLSHKFT